MSTFVPIRIPEDERIRRAQGFFDTHRLRQLRTYYPEDSLVDVSKEDDVNCWSDPPILIKKLWDLLPFCHHISAWDFNTFESEILSEIESACQEQFLYWALSEASNINNYPAETILLWNSDDYFWFVHVPGRRQHLIERIQGGERLRYLERFHLNYERVQIQFHELHVITEEGQPSLVSTEGIEFTCTFNTWDNSPWTTRVITEEPSLNPVRFHRPPTEPTFDLDLAGFAEAIELRANELRANNPPSFGTTPPLKTGPKAKQVYHQAIRGLLLQTLLLLVVGEIPSTKDRRETGVPVQESCALADIDLIPHLLHLV